MRENVLGLDAHAPVETILSGVDSRQNRGRGQKFERAAEGEALVGPMARAQADARVQDRDAQPAAEPRLDIDESFLQPRGVGRSGVARRTRSHRSYDSAEAREEFASVHHFLRALV